MDTRLLHHYQRELQHLRETAGEFAASYPKIASRLSLDGFGCADPHVERLLEGFAFMAARVQVKFDAGQERFTQHLLDTVYPGLLAPLPSLLIAQAVPLLDDPALAQGPLLPRGSTLTARIAPGEQTACTFRTAHDMRLWPLVLRQAEALRSAGEVAALGITPLPGTRAGLRLVFDVTAGLSSDQIALDRLTLHVRGADGLAARLHEQLLARGLGFVVRPLPGGLGGPGGSPLGQATALGAAAITPVGLADDEALLRQAPRGFSGHRLLQEYGAMPERLHFVAFDGLKPALQRCRAQAFELVVMCSVAEPVLERAVDANAFALHAVPAANLFARRADRVLVDPRDASHHLVVDRTRPLDYEVHAVERVVGHGAGAPRTFAPFYACGRDATEGAWFSVARQPRRLSSQPAQRATRTGYAGSEVFLSLVDTDERPFVGDLKELAAETWCSHRDLPLCLPIGGDADDLQADVSLPLAGLRVLHGPTRPRPAPAPGPAHRALIRQLSLGHLTLTGTDATQGAAALRDLLAPHVDEADPGWRRQLDGLRQVRHRPIHRRLPSPGPLAFGRGVEITLTCDDHAFEGSGAFGLALVLEQVFARHVSVNSFTETVLHSLQRGEVKRWPAQPGRRAPC